MKKQSTKNKNKNKYRKHILYYRLLSQEIINYHMEDMLRGSFEKIIKSIKCRNKITKFCKFCTFYVMNQKNERLSFPNSTRFQFCVYKFSKIICALVLLQRLLHQN